MDIRVVTATLLSMVKKYHHFFIRAAEHMGISHLTGKRLKVSLNVTSPTETITAKHFS